jgi:hypothetical protein
MMATIFREIESERNDFVLILMIDVVVDADDVFRERLRTK